MPDAAPAPVSLVKTLTPLELARRQQQARTGDAILQLTAKLIADDHWAGSAGWSGPLPKYDNTPGSAENVARVTAEIERGFVSRNLPLNVVQRHVNGIAGREPLWSVIPKRKLPKGEKPNAEEQTLIDEFTDAFSGWWDNSGVWLAIQKALTTALWSEHGTLRLFVPRTKLLPGVTDGEGRTGLGIPGGLTLTEALSFISVQAPAWDAAGVMRDIEGRVSNAYFRYADALGVVFWELQERLPDGMTRVTPVATGSEGDSSDEYPVPDLLLFEVKLDPLIKDSIRRLSRFGNKTMTMGSRNVDLGGFVERTILNAQMPGKLVKDPNSPTGETFVAGTYNVGAGVTNFLNGIAIMKKDEETGQLVPSGNFSTPSIQYKDPSGWAVFGDTFAEIREAIFDEAKQLHVLITGDASASGVSRQQAVNDFINSLEPTRMALEQLVRWVINTVLRMGLHFIGRRPEYDAFHATAQARMSAVQPTPAEVDTALKLHGEGAISEESMMGRIGIEDVAAERARRAAEGITPTLALKILALAPAWVGLKALSLAFPVLEITPEQIEDQRQADLGGAAPVGAADLNLPDDAGLGDAANP
ncbi:hypothetical protein DKM44_02250 [Deinococcus irradiatisoli]|uniref:Phage portal protein n=1 Tax=Deinococcus irradiatisoli TaxID=2202254 RepID=A0A2Z3JGY6_9DEIO|nr:hypothetical protein [Deinococcus irradiatisoli]AWN22199.1 hypothetical protein DKM44_02250 [Deinococcus irradiatisoli]